MAVKNRSRLNRRKFLLGLAGFGLLSWKLPRAAAYQPFEPFRFAYVTDVHLINDQPDSYELVHESQLFLQELVKELNAEKLDFVMFGGDQVHAVGKDEANWQLFLDCVQSLNAPWSFVLGDRDVSGSYPVDKMRTYGPDWKGRGIETDTPYWSHNPSAAPDIHLIGLDTSLPNTTIGGVSPRQLEWLRQDLEANKRLFTIVFAHHPLLPPPPFDGGPPWDEYVIPDGAAVREVLGGFPNVKLVVSGHVHVSKVQVEKDIWHISSPSLAVFPCAYRIFDVTPDMVTMETRQINFPALVKKAKKELANSSIAERYSSTDPGSYIALVEGGKEDREAVIPMQPGKPLEPYNPKKNKRAEPKAEAQTVETPKKHRRWRRHEEPAAAESRTAPVKAKPQSAPPADEPAGKAPETPEKAEPIKDINQELDKQLNMNNSNSGASEK